MTIDQQVPTTDKPKITVSEPSNLSIIEWDRLELSVKANVTGSGLSGNDIRIEKNNEKIDILCQSSPQDKTISVALTVPKKAVVTIVTRDGRIEIREPNGPAAFQISDSAVDMNVPVNSKLDLKNVAYAQLYRMMGARGQVVSSVAGQIIGTGPPYLKLSKTNAQVIINHQKPVNVSSQSGMTIQPGAAVIDKSRPLTIAAQMIALRGGMMGTSLKKSEPRLLELKKDTPSGATPKQDDASDVTLRSQLVNLNVSVTDRNSRSIAGLKAEDFSIYEDDVLQTISHFAPEQSPFNLVLLLDMSGSVKDKRPLIIEAALHFLDVIGPRDKVAVVTFTDDVISVSHLTDDREDLRDSISHLAFPTGGTAFYDALGYSLVEELRKVHRQRNAIVVLSDGEDNQLLYKTPAKPRPDQSGQRSITIGPGASQMGSFLTFEQLLEGVRESDALIYPVHIDTSQPVQTSGQSNANKSEQDTLISTTAQKQLQELADASGGRVYDAARIEDIAQIYEQVAAEMRTVYSLAYQSTNTAPDGKLRSIKVKMNRPEIVARTRPGYYPR